MRILLVHNRYQQAGGEDTALASELEMLTQRGQDVRAYVDDNHRISSMSRLSLAANTIWSHHSYRRLRDVIRHTRPDVVHFQNTFPLVSPAAYYAARHESVPVVQTLHNYRLLCPNALFYREGRVCEVCLRKWFPWPGVAHACYRGNRTATAVVATMLAVHRLVKTWERGVDVYVALTEFARQKFVEAGLPAERLAVKPNFIYPDPGEGGGCRDYALFVGRLSPEKGVRLLLRAWERLGHDVPLKIVGDGPLAVDVARATQRMPGVEWLGRRTPSEVYDLMGQAAFLVFPSEWYEGLPLTAVESFAKGTPIVAADLGAMSTVVRHRHTGLHFRPSDAEDLVRSVEWARTHPADVRVMGRAARREYERYYTSDRNYDLLMAIYDTAIARFKSHQQNG